MSKKESEKEVMNNSEEPQATFVEPEEVSKEEVVPLVSTVSETKEHTLTKEELLEQEIEEAAQARLKTVKDNDEMWITLVREQQDYFNSGDEAHFFVSKNRCKQLPEELTPIIQHALNSDVPLLREATDEELLKEFRLLEEERMISIGKMKPKKIVEKEMKI